LSSYGFTVFNIAITQALGGGLLAQVCKKDMKLLQWVLTLYDGRLWVTREAD